MQQFEGAYFKPNLVFCSQGSVRANVELVFNEGTTNLNASSAADSLTDAVNSGNFSLPINTSSISAAGSLNLSFTVNSIII